MSRFFRFRLVFVALVSALSGSLAAPVYAGVIPYPSLGTPNTAVYTFTAAATGDIVGYFGGSHASANESVGLLINGVLSPSGYGLNDHTSVVGDSFDFGAVNAGDTLVFVDIIDGDSFVYSDPSMNVGFDYDDSDGHNHVYSTTAVADQIFAGSPAGTYVAFEDEPFPYSDFNYFDDTFVFTNVSTTVAGIPEPEPLALFAIGMVGLAMRGRRRSA